MHPRIWGSNFYGRSKLTRSTTHPLDVHPVFSTHPLHPPYQSTHSTPLSTHTFSIHPFNTPSPPPPSPTLTHCTNPFHASLDLSTGLHALHTCGAHQRYHHCDRLFGTYGSVTSHMRASIDTTLLVILISSPILTIIANFILTLISALLSTLISINQSSP